MEKPKRWGVQKRYKVRPKCKKHSPLRSDRAVSSGQIVFLLNQLQTAIEYRCQIPVKEYVLHRDTSGFESAYYICPRCKVTMEREYQSYCDRCGQCLNWNDIHKATRRNLP